MLVLVGSLGELLGRPEGGGWGLVHRPPVDLQETAGLLQQVTAGELVTQLVGDQPCVGWTFPCARPLVYSLGFSPDPASLEQLLWSSFLVLPSRRAVWSAALDHWKQGR